MIDKEKKLSMITDAIQRQIIYLLSQKPSGKIELTIELNVSQGFIGSANIKRDSLVNIFK